MDGGLTVTDKALAVCKLCHFAAYFLRKAGNFLCKLYGIHRLDAVDLIDDIFHLVRLQAPDDLAGNALVPIDLFIFVHEFLHAVFADEAQAAADGVVDDLRRHGLRRRKKRDVLGLSAGAHRCLRNAVRDDLIVFLYVPKTLLKAFFRHKDLSLPQ